MYPQPPINEDLSAYSMAGAQIYTDTQFNQRLIELQARVSQVVLTLPVFEKKKVAILKTNEAEEQEFDAATGLPLAVEQEMDVFKGVEERIVSYPVPEVFTNNLVLSNLLEPEVNYLRDAHDLYIFMCQKYISTQDKTIVAFLAQLVTICESLAATARSRHGFAVEMGKMQIVKTSGDSRVQRFRLEEEIKKQSLLDKFNPFKKHQ